MARSSEHLMISKQKLRVDSLPSRLYQIINFTCPQGEGRTGLLRPASCNAFESKEKWFLPLIIIIVIEMKAGDGWLAAPKH